MTMETKHEVIRKFLLQYLKGNKQVKGRILDHLEAVVRMNRKSIVRRFAVLQKRNFRYWSDGRGRPLYYTSDVVYALSWKTVGNQNFLSKAIRNWEYFCSVSQ